METPEILTKSAREAWRGLREAVEEQELDVEPVALALYAQALGDYRDVRALIDIEGPVTLQDGERGLHPLTETAAWLSQRAIELASELGFTPAARERRGRHE
jgi:P27 family predicted phage terminase small subunit